MSVSHTTIPINFNFAKMATLAASFPPELLTVLNNLKNNSNFMNTVTDMMSQTPSMINDNDLNEINNNNNFTITTANTSLSGNDIINLGQLMVERIANAPPAIRSIAPDTYRVANDGEKTCVICDENLGDVVILPCAHLGYCMNCVKELDECAYCRVPKTGELRTFILKT